MSFKIVEDVDGGSGGGGGDALSGGSGDAPNGGSDGDAPSGGGGGGAEPTPETARQRLALAQASDLARRQFGSIRFGSASVLRFTVGSVCVRSGSIRFGSASASVSVLRFLVGSVHARRV